MNLNELLNISTFFNWRSDIDKEIDASVALYLLTGTNTVSYRPEMGTDIVRSQGQPLKPPTGILLATQMIESLQRYNDEHSFDYNNDRRVVMRMEDIEIDDKDFQAGNMDLLVKYIAIRDIESGANTLRDLRLQL